MGIEALNKAATAAGYAMATPDEEGEQVPDVPMPRSDSRALVPLGFVQQPAPQPMVNRAALARVGEWFRSYAPASLGGRATA